MDPVNQFALVVYIPDPLGRFLDDLSLELAPDCNPRAHVSVLPPRPLDHDWHELCQEAHAVTQRFAPFEVEAGGLALFPQTQVLYLELKRGAKQFEQMHAALNGNSLSYPEPYPYHAHITLAQNIPAEAVADLRKRAERLWREYSGPRTFLAANAVCVRNAAANLWIDLGQFKLGA